MPSAPFTIPGATSENWKELATVTSAASPLRKEKHRSSGNFGVDSGGGDFNAFYWQVTRNASNTYFNVLIDRSGKSDSDAFHDLRDGSVTEPRWEHSLYIADPRGGHDFDVKVWGVKLTWEAASVLSLPHPGDHQDHRSSGNFATHTNPGSFSKMRFVVTLPRGDSDPAFDAGKVRFAIYNDNPEAGDQIIDGDVFSGKEIDYREGRRFYVGDPSGSDGKDFLVTVYVR